MKTTRKTAKPTKKTGNVAKTKRGFTITRPACIVCQEPPFGGEYACGHSQEPAPPAAEQTAKRAKGSKPPKAPVADATPKDSKKDQVLAMLRRPGGATNAEIQEATGWKPHTVRGFLATAPKKLGKRITTSTNDAGARVYHMFYNAEK